MSIQDDYEGAADNKLATFVENNTMLCIGGVFLAAMLILSPTWSKCFAQQSLSEASEPQSLKR
ncbi:MAG: hypothetical protein CMH30_07355 [Micavibrio sp.]|nr:hypothetical protein [Micavibrio sp.]|tara:strand:+ start:428 stop:616 length:189 start_codon:yes stop_codon:yes gene_type:complete